MSDERLTPEETLVALDELMRLGLVECRLRPDGRVEYRITERARTLEREQPELLPPILSEECRES